MSVTVDMILKLKKDRDVLKSNIEQAKGRLAAVEAQLEKQVEELTKMGVTPETVQDVIISLDSEIFEIYEKAYGLLEDIRNGCN